ncbi:uncharacterized protein LOC111328049 [Stylophora pistillata]|uniref:uncharacterized protein LOC111328049 n=1 Tax=Stylophora pistillata TaxID=50429 RepID=UPI000C03D6AC|nr:uncharacterized protein LOC111328049 [Stylophora pistillata]
MPYFSCKKTCYLSQIMAERYGKAPMIQRICSTNFRAELNLVIRLRSVGRFESHGVRYLVGRIKRYPNSTSTSQLTRVAISGDVSLNPGPSVKPKCGVCSRTLARNHRAVLCYCCKGLSHIKCANVTPSEYKRIQDLPNKTWVCSACMTISTHNDLPFHGIGNTTLEDLFMNEPAVMDYTDQIDSQDRDFASFMDVRVKYSSNFLTAHLNINSYQNKFEEMREIIQKLRIQVIFIGETKIDSSYPDAQFAISGYQLYRSDRMKGGGGLLAYASSKVICKRLKVPGSYRTIESLVLDVELKGRRVIVAGLYRPPKPRVSKYQLQLGEEINHFCNWASMQGHALVLLGDLNLDRLRSDKPEGKLLIDTEETHGLECVITEPTRIQTRAGKTTKTLIDVILTNEAHLFVQSGIYEPGLSDHPLVYGFMQDTAAKVKPRIIKFRSVKNFDKEKFQEHLNSAPWHVGEVFDSVEDRVGFNFETAKKVLRDSTCEVVVLVLAY